MCRFDNNNAEIEAQRQFLSVASAIAKYNAIVRMRFPVSDPFYQKVEACLFGTFWDMPLPLVVFLDAAETTSGLSFEQHEAFARQLKRTLITTQQRESGKPERDRRGEILWKKTLPFAMRALPDEIGRTARDFFDSVYSLEGADRKSLAMYEKKFWVNHRRLCSFQRRAKRDRQDLYRILLTLRRHIPEELCGHVLRMAL